MPIQWQDKAVQDRLLMAVIASTDNNINIKEIARLYGGEMTYNAVENYLRRFRKEAKTMKAAAEGRETPVPSPARPRTKKAAGGVKVGRVTKGKKAPAVKVKEEVVSKSIFGGWVLNSGDEDGGFGLGGSEVGGNIEEDEEV